MPDAKVIDILFLIFAYLFTFLIPGLYIVENFFESINSRLKLPLYLLLSIMVSTYAVFATSLIMGYSRFSILVASSLFLPWFIYFAKKNFFIILKVINENHVQFIVGLVVFLIYITALYPGIFTVNDGYVVMSSSNWQDTAMHSGIIESISQGNFPPQAPYYAGVPLNYYYFTDFHSSIIETLYNNFFPRVLVYDNPIFAMTFSFTVFALAYEITKSKLVSVFSTLSASFYGSLMYLNFAKDLFNVEKGNLFLNAISLLTNNSYAIEFAGFFQISPMADYYLQNRPMMIGLPAVVLVFALTSYIYKENKVEWMLLPGLISALLLKFQFFAFIVSIFVFGIVVLFNIRKDEIRKIIKSIAYFLIIPLLFVLIFSGATKINNQSMISVVMENIKFEPWEEGKNFLWYVKFLFANLGFPLIVLMILIPLNLFFKKINKNTIVQSGPGVMSAILLSTIPFLCKFTIMKYDMLKFYYFSEIFISIVCFLLLYKIIKNKYLYILVAGFILFFTIPTSLTNLTNSFLNKSIAYTLDEVEVGNWIRSNTSRRSVFMDLANLHSPITEIAGRLRVLSYINWPHSHGYNQGEDNVFTRLEDIRSVYSGTAVESDFLKIMKKYKINYIYYGSVEKSDFDDADDVLDKNIYLTKVYDKNEIKIYKFKN